jgi:hypothetical protein
MGLGRAFLRELATFCVLDDATDKSEMAFPGAKMWPLIGPGVSPR